MHQISNSKTVVPSKHHKVSKHDKQEIINKNQKTCEGQKTPIRKSTGEKL